MPNIDFIRNFIKQEC